MRTVTCGACGGNEFISQSIYRLQVPKTAPDLSSATPEITQVIYICLFCRKVLEKTFKPFLEFIVLTTPRDKIRKASEFYQKYGKDIYFICPNIKELIHLEAGNLKKQACSIYLLDEVGEITTDNVFITSIHTIPEKLHKKNIFAVLTDNEYRDIDEIAFLEKWGNIFNIRFWPKGNKIS